MFRNVRAAWNSFFESGAPVFDDDFDDEFGYDYGWAADDYAESNSTPGSVTGAVKETNVVEFSTGNAVVRTLPVGAILKVVGAGRVAVIDNPGFTGGAVSQAYVAPALTAADFSAGDRINTKYGEATVVRPSSRFSGIEGFDPSTQVLYVADDEPVVRRANPADIELI